MKMGQFALDLPTVPCSQRCVDMFSHGNGHMDTECTLQEKKHCLYSPMGAWLRIALVALAYNVTDWPM